MSATKEADADVARMKPPTPADDAQMKIATDWYTWGFQSGMEAERKTAAPRAAPVAWRYELAHAREWCLGKPVGWSDWRWHLTETMPNVPQGSIRNLTPLVAAA